MSGMSGVFPNTQGKMEAETREEADYVLIGIISTEDIAGSQKVNG